MLFLIGGVQNSRPMFRAVAIKFANSQVTIVRCNRNVETESSCVSTNRKTMETYDISDDRTVSVVKVQDGEKTVIIKENGSLVKFIDLTPSR